jgi:hypothetical protein
MKIKDFFRYWSNVDKDDLNLKITLYTFYIKNGFKEFLVPATTLINSTDLPHREFEKLTSSSRLQGLGDSSYILHLINYRPFVESLNTTQKKKYLIDYLNKSMTFNLKSEDLNRSLLYNSIEPGEEKLDPN